MGAPISKSHNLLSESEEKFSTAATVEVVLVSIGHLLDHTDTELCMCVHENRNKRKETGDWTPFLFSFRLVQRLQQIFELLFGEHVLPEVRAPAGHRLGVDARDSMRANEIHKDLIVAQIRLLVLVLIPKQEDAGALQGERVIVTVLTNGDTEVLNRSNGRGGLGSDEPPPLVFASTLCIGF